MVVVTLGRDIIKHFKNPDCFFEMCCSARSVAKAAAKKEEEDKKTAAQENHNGILIIAQYDIGSKLYTFQMKNKINGEILFISDITLGDDEEEDYDECDCVERLKQPKEDVAEPPTLGDDDIEEDECDCDCVERFEQPKEVTEPHVVVVAATATEDVNPEEGDDDSPSDCVICMDAEKTHILVPCGHQCVCHQCADVVLGGGICPVCRGDVRSVVKVYI
jgi:hypothetical protein